MQEKYGNPRDEAFYKELFKDAPVLCGQVCAWLATGEGKDLRGMYLGEYISSLAPHVSIVLTVTQIAGKT